MELWIDIRPRCRSEAEHVAGEVLRREAVHRGNRRSAPQEERSRTLDRLPEDRQWVGALIVDVGTQQFVEIGDQPSDRGLDDDRQLGIVGPDRDTAARRCADRRPMQPTWRHTTGRVEQHPGRIERLLASVHLRRHTISSIVSLVRTPHRRRRRPALIAALGVVAMAGAGCTDSGDEDVSPTTSVAVTTTTVPKRDDDGRLVVGVYLPQTGTGASLGEPMITAVREAVDHINEVGGALGSPVELLVLDEGSPAGPSTLLGEGVDAIVGPASSRNALAQLASIVRPDTGVVTCSPTASALALDDFPDNGFFFRTVPSDSLQMVAIARRAERTGVPTVAVGYLDDPFGRGLAGALVDEIELRRRQEVVADVAFSPDQEDLTSTVAELLADEPGLVIVLGDADDGGRLLSALDTATPDENTQVIVNSAIRIATSIQQLSPGFRSRLTGVAPLAANEGDPGFFTAHAVDCVNLIALATIEAGSDSPSSIKNWMAPVSGGGRQCSTFDDCAGLLEQGLQIDYNGLSGVLELSNTTGDPTRASFVQFGFDSDGTEIDTRIFEAP